MVSSVPLSTIVLILLSFAALTGVTIVCRDHVWRWVLACSALALLRATITRRLPGLTVPKLRPDAGAGCLANEGIAR